MRMIVVLILCLFVAAAPRRAEAQDDMRAVGALWADFTAALRRGDYPGAHGLFSAESQKALPYRDFVREYGPMSIAREMVLAKAGNLSTRVDGEWAEIVFSGVSPVTGGQFRVGAALTRNQGAWGLVAARNEERENIEAIARGLLAMMADWRNEPDVGERLVQFASGGKSDNPLFKFYRFTADSGRIRAVPAADGFRTFYLDDWGTVRPVLSPEAMAKPPPEAAPHVVEEPASVVAEPADALPPLPPPPPPEAWMGMGELPEPPPLPASVPMGPGELPEPALPPLAPPPLPVPSGGDTLEPERFSLPDSIG